MFLTLALKTDDHKMLETIYGISRIETMVGTSSAHIFETCRKNTNNEHSINGMTNIVIFRTRLKLSHDCKQLTTVTLATGYCGI